MAPSWPFGNTAPAFPGAPRTPAFPGAPRTPASPGAPRTEIGTVPQRVDEPDVGEVVEPDRPWVVIVWNDPVNLMSYVVYVFQKLFHYSREKATRLMLDVHHKGKAVVSQGSREQAEADVFRLHAHGLWATMQRD